MKRDRDEEREPESSATRRPQIGVFFRCCQVYQRIYRSPGADRYTGFCPRCLRQVTVRVGPGGTTDRIFEAE